MQNNLKKIALLIVLAVFVSGCSKYLPGRSEEAQEAQMPEAGEVALNAEQGEEIGSIVTDSDVEHQFVFIAQEDDQTALEVTEANTEVIYDEYDFGVFVTGVGGVAADEAHFWALYINGELSNTGADATIVSSGDEVKWQYDEVDGYEEPQEDSQ